MAILSRTLWAKIRAWRGASQEPADDEQADRRPALMALGRADPASVRASALADMTQMMWHVGADPRRVPQRFAGALREAERACAHCLWVGRCRRWLHGRASTDAPRLFCPNAELFTEIARGQAQAKEPARTARD